MDRARRWLASRMGCVAPSRASHAHPSSPHHPRFLAPSHGDRAPRWPRRAREVVREGRTRILRATCGPLRDVPGRAPPGPAPPAVGTQSACANHPSASSARGASRDAACPFFPPTSLASLVSDTKAGRSQLVKSLGEHGQAFIACLEAVTEKCACRYEPRRCARRGRLASRPRLGGLIPRERRARAAERLLVLARARLRLAVAGKELGETFVRDLVKLMTKVGLLMREGRISAAAAAPVREPIFDLARELLDLLHQRAGALDVGPLVAHVDAMRDRTIELVTPLMREKNSRMVAVLTGFFGSREFLSAVVNDADFQPDRIALREVIRNALLAEGKLAGIQLCTVPGCELPRCKIVGSTFCLGHHALKFSKPPTLADFLTNTTYFALFRVRDTP